MASSSKAEAPSLAVCQSNFEQGVALALSLWPDLALAVQNSWGGPDSSDKRDWFAGAVVDLFPDLSANRPAASSPEAEPDVAYVEEFLLQVMLDEFEVNVDDDSSLEVAEQVVRMRAECAKGRFEDVDALRTRWEGRKGKQVVFKKAEDQDEDTDWDSDDDDDGDEEDEDVEMGDAPPHAPTTKAKDEPEVDEDGFTTVTRKKR